jgi:hypothetical protein
MERMELKYEAVPEAGCWLWTGAISQHGYGRFYFRGKAEAAHRASYILYRSEIPEGLEIDHLCRTRNCVNPDHLEPVTPKVNRLRGYGWAGIHSRRTHCPKGHQLVSDRYHGHKRRWCETCFGGMGGPSNAAKTHCKRGHEFTDENTRRWGAEGRYRACRECERLRNYKPARQSYEAARRHTPEYIASRKTPEARARAAAHQRAYRARRAATQSVMEVSLGAA